MNNWRDRIWFFDTEVLPHDWLFCAEHIKGERFECHNNNDQLIEWLQTNHPILCGFNCKHYDQYIVKGILKGVEPEGIKKINDAIIVEGIQGWRIDLGWIKSPSYIDLMLDLPTRPSLKVIEGNLKMDIQESSVDFNTEYPTEEEWSELVEYCWHDVEALIPLYEKRLWYLEAKETLAEMANIDVVKALNMTNAKLTALYLRATTIERDDEREYVYPTNIDRDYIPQEVFDFFDKLPDSDISLDILFGREGVPDEDGKIVKSRNPHRNLTIDIAGCPSIVAWGGLHGAIKNYREETTEDRIIWNADATSYYPSLMIVNGYISRNNVDPEMFKQVFETRVEAKKNGNKKVNQALKLVLNTTYGASNNKYNALYDPLMAHSVCISGQLYLIQLAEKLNDKVSSLKVIQLNTDGIMFSVNKNEKHIVRQILDEWQETTGFGLEDDFVSKVVQRDVNNYVMLKTDGKVKVKGGVVSDYEGGTFKHNSLSVTCKAVVDYLLFDKPIEETITECNDPFAFQMISKAGRSFDRVLHEVNGEMVEVNRVNRLYAVNDEKYGMVYKMKGDRKNKVPNCPEHTFVDNLGILTIDKINKQWYIELTRERVEKFLGITRRKKKMATEKVEEKKDTKEVKKRTTTKKVPSFKEKMYQLGLDITEMSKGFIKDGYNDAQSYEYVKASQYKTLFRECIAKNRLLYKIDDAVCQVMPEALKSAKMTLTLYHASLTIKDVDSDEKETFMLWSQGADNLDKGLSKAKTLALKDFVKSNFGISDNEDDPEASPTTAPASPKKTKFVPPTDKAKAKKEVMSQSDKASDEQKAQIKDWVQRIREKSDHKSFAEKTLSNLDGMTSSKASVTLTKLELKGNEYGLEV